MVPSEYETAGGECLEFDSPTFVRQEYIPIPVPGVYLKCFAIRPWFGYG